MSLRLRRGFRGFLLASAMALPMAATPLLPALQAHAADVTAAQAQDVAKQLQDWLSTLLGGKVPLPPDLFNVAPAGELYRLTIPVPPGFLVMQDGAGKSTNAIYTAGLRPLGGTRWGIEEFRMPAAITLSPEAASGLSIGLAGAAGMGATPPGGKPGAAAAPGMEIRIRSQSATGVYDTSLKTESRMEVTTQGISVRSNGLGQASQRSEGTVDRFTGLFHLRPTASGGVDTVSDWTMDGYAGVTSDPTVGEMKVSARRIRIRGEIGALMTMQVTSALQTGIQMAMDSALQITPPNPADKLGDAGRAKLKAIIAALKGVMSGLAVEETIEGFSLAMMGQSGSAERILFTFGGSAPGAKFGAHLELGVDGLKVTGLPPQYADLLPRSVSVRPTVSNVDVAALTALAEQAVDPKADMDMLQTKLIGLFTGNGVKVGIERLLIDLGSTKLTATGSLTPTSPMTATGQAEIGMTGYDALMDRVQKMPEAMQAIPVLALVRGLARTEGDKLVWRLAMTEDQKITVNGVDLRKLGGG